MKRAFRFAAVGIAAAGVHMGAFALGQALLRLGDAAAWLASFVVAASAAWLMNRAYTFRDRSAGARPGQWLRYLGAAGLGAAAHFATFQLALASFEFVARHPWLGILPGSLASFAVTYAGASSFVFRSASSKP